MKKIKRELKVGYKVLYNTFNKGVKESCIIKRDLHKLEYIENKKTYRRLTDGAIAVFDTLENANDFKNGLAVFNREIWLVEYRESIHKSLWIHKNPYKKKEFYDNPFFRKEIEYKTFNVPFGTCYADNVKLINEVKT